MNKIILFAFSVLFSFVAQSQVEKRTWLLGGNASFASDKFSNTLGEMQQHEVAVNGNAGYFFVDKLAIGIRPSIYWAKTGNASGGWSAIGPFLRYYFLPVDRRVNVFAEGSYAYGTDWAQDQSSHSSKYAFLGGPVYFLNSAVAVELSIGYSVQKFSSTYKTSIFQTGVGFQFHLIRDKQ